MDTKSPVIIPQVVRGIQKQLTILVKLLTDNKETFYLDICTFSCKKFRKHFLNAWKKFSLFSQWRCAILVTFCFVNGITNRVHGVEFSPICFYLGGERERLKCHKFLLSFLLPFWRTKDMSIFMYVGVFKWLIYLINYVSFSLV